MAEQVVNGNVRQVYRPSSDPKGPQTGSLEEGGTKYTFEHTHYKERDRDEIKVDDDAKFKKIEGTDDEVELLDTK